MSIRRIVAKQIHNIPYVLGLVLGATLLTGSAQGFFPALPPTNNLNQGGGTPPSGGTTPGAGTLPPGSPPPPPATSPAGGGQTPAGPPGGSMPPSIPVPPPPPPPPGIPEIDPGSLAGALGILISGALMLLDRRRR